MWALSLPMVGSLIAEPLTGLVDGLFIARLGSVETAALGVGVPLISLVLFAFNFLGIGTQTRVAQELGRGEPGRASEVAGLAASLAFVLGLGILALGMWAAPAAVSAMGADGATHEGALTYLRIRLFGAPAVLCMMAAFGALRGMQDMRTPLWIAVATNVLNVALDAALIFGLGPLPALELAGAAWASTLAQWMGAIAALRVLTRRLGLPRRLTFDGAGELLTVGRDLFFRTALLLLFVAFAGRSATRLGADAGAAHHIVRSIFSLSAFMLDAFAIVSQSLVSYFLASGQRDIARRVAGTCLQWSFGTGVAVALAMAAGTPLFLAALPETARDVGLAAWWIAALSQPLASASFATDGVHWGTGDYRFLRNAMTLSTLGGVALLMALDTSGQASLAGVWYATVLWIGVRGALGMLRIWPGFGQAPLGRRLT